jgi:hypothetical protein
MYRTGKSAKKEKKRKKVISQGWRERGNREVGA